ncbi:MAG: CHAT domain-containing tetratricopeptide repeat protein, partial [Sodalinema sp.]|uniref:CHAT domain-containing protein n=1 Tax=Sodalinema sp. TaxID=3080550 RepID=UPI00396F46B4
MFETSFEEIQRLRRQSLMAYETGDYARGVHLAEQACHLGKSAFGTHHSEYATLLNNLALLYWKMGRWGEAEPLYRQAMEIRKQQLGDGHPDYATSLNDLASLYLATNRPNAALELMQDAITIQNRVLGEVFAISSDRQRLAYLEQSYWQLEVFLSLVQQHFSHDPNVTQAALDVLLQRKGLATEAGLVLRTSILSQRYRHLAPQYEEYRELIRQQAYLQFQAPPQLQDKLPQQLQALRQKQEALEQVLGRQIPEMNLEQQLKQANCQAIAANLPPGSSLVEFVQYHPYNFSAIPGEPSWSSPRYLAFILTAGQPEAVEMLDLGEVAPIDEDCRRFRRWASGEHSKSSPDSRVAALDIPETAQDTPSYDYPEVGKHLYQRLIQPLTPYLSPQQVLYLCPDGELTTLPFSLLSRDGIQELMGEFELRYLNVGRDILRLTVKIPVQLSQPLVIANPDFNLGLHLPQEESLVAAASPQGRQFRLRLPREVILATLVSLGFFGVLLLLALFPEWVGGLLLLGILLLPVVLPRWLELSDSANPGVSSAVGSSGIRADDFNSGPSLADRAKMAVNLGSLRRELGSQEKLPFSPLPGTQLEGERVAQFLGVAAYLDGQAVKSLLSQCRSPKVLHLATHGYFLGLTSQESPTAETASEMAWGGKLASGLDPLTRSGLALAGANTALVSPGELPVEAEEGLLTAQGTMGLDLTGTWLVVLSACDTALGGKSIGEGVMGLRRSFILAGAETVVMSLWSVPDVPTAILMNRFYENLFERGLPRTKGLEEAQAYLRGLRVGQIRQTWLTDKVIARVGVISYKSGQWLKELSGKPDDWRPFVSPEFWAAFVC